MRHLPVDDVDIAYDSECDDASSMLAATIAARMNHFFTHEKRFAGAAAALVARYEGRAYASTLDFAVTNGVAPWTLITLLHVLFEFEVAPYEATIAAAPILQSVAAGDLVSARVLARVLLDRAGLEVPIAPPRELPISPGISNQRASQLAEAIGTERLKRINRLWPKFGQNAIARMDVVHRSDDLRHRMGRALDRFRLGREGRRLQVWYPVDEEVERVLQTTGAAVRGALAEEGIIDPSVEDQIGMQLLRDTQTMVRLVLSRVIRPTYADQITSKSLGAHVGEPIRVESGACEGWVVVGFHEMESKITGFSAVDTRISTYSGVVFSNGVLGDDPFPFGHGDARVWSFGPCQEVPWGPLAGPISGIQRIVDPFGRSLVFVPHPALVEMGGLTPVPFDGGLTLVDKDGQSAVVSRTWRLRLIGSEYFDDREHRIEGFDMLVREDVFAMVSSIASHPPKLVTVVSEIKSVED